MTKLFNEGNSKYSDFNRTYPILKVYVNGTINREIEVNTNRLRRRNWI